jgi:hypothetical protein
MCIPCRQHAPSYIDAQRAPGLMAGNLEDAGRLLRTDATSSIRIRAIRHPLRKPGLTGGDDLNGNLRPIVLTLLSATPGRTTSARRCCADGW